MKNFTKLVEQIESKRYFKVLADMEIVYQAEDDGECGFMAYNDLSKINNSSNYINRIEEISKDEYDLFKSDKVDESVSDYINSLDKDMNPSEKLKKTWQNKEGLDKYEFYHQMRNLGYDPSVIKSSTPEAGW